MDVHPPGFNPFSLCYVRCHTGKLEKLLPGTLEGYFLSVATINALLDRVSTRQIPVVRLNSLTAFCLCIYIDKKP